MISNNIKKRIIVFTKLPEPGTCKTRLISVLSSLNSAHLQKKMTSHIINISENYCKKDSSCGCIKKTKQSKPRTHWLTWTGIQRSYYHLKDRCENPDNKRYYDYWGRGIKNLWNSFEAFVNDMRGTWQEWLQIDRIDNNWHYCKENCKWSNRKEQMNNKRNNVIIKYNWKKLTLTQWGRELNIPYKRLEARYRRGWSIDRLFIN